MALILETALRNAIANAIDAEINTGVGTATFVFQTVADVAVATLNLPNPAFDNAGTGGAGVIQLQGTPLQDTNAAGGTTVQFSIFDRDGTKQLEGTVATSGADVNISSTVVGATDTVELTSFSITVPAT